MNRTKRYSAERVKSIQMDEPKDLFWSDDFEELTASNDSGSRRMATLEELRRFHYQPLRPTEIFRVAEGLYFPVCVWESGAFSKWEYHKLT